MELNHLKIQKAVSIARKRVDTKRVLDIKYDMLPDDKKFQFLCDLTFIERSIFESDDERLITELVALASLRIAYEDASYLLE